MKRLVLGSLLSCMVVGQISCWPDVLDCVWGTACRVANYISKSVSAMEPGDATTLKGAAGAASQAAVLGSTTWLGTCSAGLFAGNEKVLYNARRNGRIALAMAACGSLYKGGLMASVKDRSDLDRLYADHEILSHEEFIAESPSSTQHAGTGKMIGAGVVFAGLAVTARRPAALSRAWNWFSKPSSRIVE